MNYRSFKRFRLGPSIVILVALAAPAFAALGSSEASIETDRSGLNATSRIVSERLYSVHELIAPTGVAIREYVSPSGNVFAVSWRGPFMPNLKQILGVFFLKFSEAARAESRTTRSHLVVRQPEFVLESAGHMRSYYGRAYDPALLPAGVSVDDLR